MKPIFIKLFVLSVSLLSLFFSCQKDNVSISENPDLIAAAQKWYQFNKTSACQDKVCLSPKWDEAVVKVTNSKEHLIIVPADKNTPSNNPKLGIETAYIFTSDGHIVYNGKIVSIIGEKQTLKNHRDNLFLDFKNKSVKRIDEGAVFLYDVNNNYQAGNYVQNGVLVPNKESILVKRTSSMLQGDSGANSPLEEEDIATLSSSGEAQDCTDWYWVTWNNTTGQVLSEQYVTTTCNAAAPGGGGGSSVRPYNEPPPCSNSFHFVQKISANPANLATEGGWQVAAIDDLRIKINSNAYPPINALLPRMYLGLPIYRYDGTQYTYETAQQIAVNAVGYAENAAVQLFRTGAPHQAIIHTYKEALNTAMALYQGRANTGSPGTNITILPHHVTTATYGTVTLGGLMFGCN